MVKYESDVKYHAKQIKRVVMNPHCDDIPMIITLRRQFMFIRFPRYYVQLDCDTLQPYDPHYDDMPTFVTLRYQVFFMRFPCYYVE
jgi:hypothetical protein